MVTTLLSQIIEGLWGLGVTQQQLEGIPTTSPEAMKAAMQQRGIDVGLFDKAKALVEWRMDPRKSARDNFSELLRLMKLSSTQVDAIITGAGSNKVSDLLASVARVVSPQIATNMAIKIGSTTAIPTGGFSGFTWNPYRGDAPKTTTTTAPGAPGAAPTITTTAPFEQKSGAWRSPTPGATLEPLGGQPGTGGAPGTGGVPGADVMPKPTPAQLRDALELQYGWAAALMDQPEVAHIIDMVMNGSWSIAEAGRQFLSTNFYKNTRASQRDFMIMERTSPEQARSLVNDQLVILQGQAKVLGIDPNNPRLRELAHMSLRLGWKDDETKRALGAEVKYDPSGRVGTLSAALKDQAKQYLVPISDQTMQAWATSIAQGLKTPEEFQGYLREQAVSYLPSLAPILDDPNITPMKFLSTYGEIAANTLGVDPNAIDWQQPKWMRALNVLDPKTGQRSTMNYADWQTTLMTDPQYGWKETTPGKQQRAALGKKLLTEFGFAS